MQPHQQQTVNVVPVQPQQAYAVRTPGPFNHRQATVIGILLIAIGCLSILFNAIDLAVGTAMSRYYERESSSIYYTSYYSYSRGYVSYEEDDTLSHASLGTAGHGIWCGAVVSVHTWFSGLFRNMKRGSQVSVALAICRGRAKVEGV